MIDRSLNYGRHLIKRFLREAGDFETVLDIGAGHGSDLYAAKEINPAADLHGVEVDEDAIVRLRRKGVTVHRLNIEQDPLPFADNSVDVVISNQTLEHVKELFWIFHEISRVLRPGGTLIVGVPNLAALHNRVLLMFGRQPSPLQNASAHVRGYTKGDIAAFLEAGFPRGYEPRGFGGSNFYPFPPPLARPLAKIFPTMAWGIFLVFRKRTDYAGEFLTYPVREQLQTNFFLGRNNMSPDSGASGEDKYAASE